MPRFVFDEPQDYLSEIASEAPSPAPRFVFDDETPVATATPAAQPKTDGFLSEMGDNFIHGIQSASDLLAGNFQDINGRNYAPTPKTTALNDKVFPPGYEGGFMDAAGNALRYTSASDWSGALLEKFGETPEGKALAAMGGINPVWNAASTAVNRYVNPAISKVTGIHPDNLALMEMGAGTLGLKQAGKVSDPTLNALRSLNNKMGTSGVPTPKPKMPTSAEVRMSASQKYDAANAAGGVLRPNLTDAWINSASKILPQTPAGKIIRGETPATQLVDRMQSLRGKPLTLEEAQEIYSALGDMAESHVDPLTGKLLAEGKKFSDIQDSLWNTMDTASSADIAGGKAGFEAWKQGKADWAKAMRMNEVERILQRAEGKDNPATVIKNGFAALRDNPKRFNKFNVGEKSAIKHAAKHGALIGPLKFMGSRLISSTAGAMAGAFGGGPVGAGVGTAVGATIGTAPRAIANAMQLGRGQKVLNTVARGPKPAVPLGQQFKQNQQRALNAGKDATFGAVLTGEELKKVRMRP